MDTALRVLVIDDEQIVLDSVRKHLSKANFEVHTVLSATKGLKAAEQQSFDLVLTDLMMPQIDGLELMKIIQTRYPGLPVVMMTGYATISTAQQAEQMGAAGYVAKPFSRAELLEVVRLALGDMQE